MRKYPKEKDVVLSYLEKKDYSKFSPSVTWNEYFHDFNNFTPSRAGTKINFYDSGSKFNTTASRNEDSPIRVKK